MTSDADALAERSCSPPPLHLTLSAILHANALQKLLNALKSGRRTALLTGGDSLTRLSLSHVALPDAWTASCMLSNGGSDLLGLTSTISNGLVLHDVDARDAMPALVAILDTCNDRPVLGTAADADAVPISLKHAHRFDVHVNLRAPLFDARNLAWVKILQHLIPALPVSATAAFAAKLADVSPGFGMRDMIAAVIEYQTGVAGPICDPFVEADMLLATVSVNRPSGHAIGLPFASGGFSISKNDSWDNVGGYEPQKKRLERAIGWGVMHGTTFARLGTRAPRGVLLHGPRGTGKTLLARAMIGRLSSVNAVCVSASDLYARYLGESEQRVRDLFKRARELAPCVVLLDDIDAIAADRAGDEADGGTGVERRVLGALLAELDGVGADQEDASVTVLACTSQLERIDPALLRPGRIDQLVEMTLPDLPDRLAILRCVARDMPVAEKMGCGKVDDGGKSRVLHAVAEKTEGRTGADLAGICRRAGLIAMEESKEPDVVLGRHFMSATRELSGDGLS